jgi:hypothetical protein
MIINKESIENILNEIRSIEKDSQAKIRETIDKRLSIETLLRAVSGRDNCNDRQYIILLSSLKMYEFLYYNNQCFERIEMSNVNFFLKGLEHERNKEKSLQKRK